MCDVIGWAMSLDGTSLQGTEGKKKILIFAQVEPPLPQHASPAHGRLAARFSNARTTDAEDFQEGRADGCAGGAADHHGRGGDEEEEGQDS